MAHAGGGTNNDVVVDEAGGKDVVDVVAGGRVLVVEVTAGSVVAAVGAGVVAASSDAQAAATRTIPISVTQQFMRVTLPGQEAKPHPPMRVVSIGIDEHDRLPGPELHPTLEDRDSD